MKLKLIRIGSSQGAVIPFRLIQEVKEELEPNEQLVGFNVSVLRPIIKLKE